MFLSNPAASTFMGQLQDAPCFSYLACAWCASKSVPPLSGTSLLHCRRRRRLDSRNPKNYSSVVSRARIRQINHTLQPMIRTGELVKALKAIGVETPPRPVPPFEVIPELPTVAEIELDEAYQRHCREWIAAVAQIYSHHFPDGA